MSRTASPWVLAAAVAWQIAAAAPASAATSDLAPLTVVFGAEPAAAPTAAGDPGVWRVDFGAGPGAADAPALPAVAVDVSAAGLASAVAQAPVRRPVAYTYSDGYELRARIHRYASFLTLPLFGAQYLLGNKLDEGRAPEAVRASHAAIATTMVGLFGVNTVTGVWNLWEGRNDPANRKRRFLHGILMLASDAGFVATGMLAPTNDGGGNRSLHKSVAITSMGVATAGYLLMLLGQ
ncbi:MAG: hypothetical protein AB7O28_18245 [Vicinamibacterales bacterium]